MIVYPTHRSASFPQRIYDTSIKNAATGELVDDGEGVDQVAEGFPFPILDKDPAKAGMEAIWNHKLKFKGVSFARWNNQAIPTASGQYTLIRFREEGLGLYYKPGNTLKDINNILLYFSRTSFRHRVSPDKCCSCTKPGFQKRTASGVGIQPRPAPRAPRAEHRLRQSGHRVGRSSHQRHDRYVQRRARQIRLELVGKKEMYVPYNSYKAHSDQTRSTI